MSQRTDSNDDPTIDDTGDTGERTTLRNPAANRVAPESTGAHIGGEPAAPGTQQYRDEVEHTATTPFGIGTGLLWTVGILLAVLIVLLLIFNL